VGRLGDKLLTAKAKTMYESTFSGVIHFLDFLTTPFPFFSVFKAKKATLKILQQKRRNSVN
jgi:hypothetical protein